MSAVRLWASEVRGYLGLAILLFIFSGLSCLLLVQAPGDRLLWTGTKVVGTQKDGLVFYSWRGQNYSLEVPGYASNPRVAVYFSPSQPSDAFPDSFSTRLTDVMLTVVPVGLGIALLGAGEVRRRQRLKASATSDFGQGIDDEFVQRKLNEIRRER